MTKFLLAGLWAVRGSAVLGRSRSAQGRRLQYFTISWNTVGDLVAVVAELIAGRISLVGSESPASLKRGRDQFALGDVG